MHSSNMIILLVVFDLVILVWLCEALVLTLSLKWLSKVLSLHCVNAGGSDTRRWVGSTEELRK
jgi:lipoprotein signal peptidase